MRTLRIEHTLRMSEEEVALIAFALEQLNEQFDWNLWGQLQSAAQAGGPLEQAEQDLYEQGRLLSELLGDFGIEANAQGQA